MLKNWFRYLIILLCTTAFYICFSGYYSLYAILACLALPVLSLLLSLPAMLTLRLYLESPEAPQNKGESFSLRLTASHRSPLPCGRAWAAVNGLNQFTGDRCQGRVEFTPSRQPLAVEYQASSDPPRQSGEAVLPGPAGRQEASRQRRAALQTAPGGEKTCRPVARQPERLSRGGPFQGNVGDLHSLSPSLL